MYGEVVLFARAPSSYEGQCALARQHEFLCKRLAELIGHAGDKKKSLSRLTAERERERKREREREKERECVCVCEILFLHGVLPVENVGEG